jgi:predicted permease
MRLIDQLRQDLAYALRGFRRAPGFSFAVIATLALGVGANSALFSLADRLFLRQPNGVRDPSHLRRMYVRSNWTVGSVWEIRDVFSYGAFAGIRDNMAPRAHAAAYTPPDSVPFGDGETRRSVRGVYATSDFLTTLGVRPALGRFFAPPEDEMGNGTPVAVISHDFWERAFDADSSVIGRVVSLARQKFTIVGVAATGFAGIDLDPVDVVMPLAVYPAPGVGKTPWYASWRSGFQLRIVARVVPGTTDAWLSAAGTPAYRNGERQFVSRGPDTAATVLGGPLLAAQGPTLEPRTNVSVTTRLLGVAAIVLLIACANVANLLLARGIERQGEIAMRRALGASRSRLVAQHIVEGVVLASAAGFAAAIAGVFGGAALRFAVLGPLEWGTVSIDWRVIGATLCVSLAVGVFVSMIPALRSAQTDLARTSKAGMRAGPRERLRLRSVLVVVQAALSLVLLAGAGVFARSLDRARGIDLGFDTERLLYATVRFVNPEQHYVERNGRHLSEIYHGLRDDEPRIARIPGVEAVALASAAPLGGYAMIGLHLEGGQPAPRVDDLDPALLVVTPSYFAAMKMRLVRGRSIENADSEDGSEAVVVVNEMTARTYWPQRDAIGQCVYIRTNGPDSCSRVVGVVHDSHLDDLLEKPRVAIYAPVRGGPETYTGNPTFLIVRAGAAAVGSVAGNVRRVLRETFPNAEPPAISLVATRVENQLRPWKLGAFIFTAFGVLSLVVAGLGIYSVNAYAVTQRTHEIAIRVALGARRERVLAMILAGAVRVTLVGVVVGLGLTLSAGRLVSSMLYDTSPRDPLVLGASLVLLLVVTVVACVVPAQRAARTDPAVALRAD